MIDADTRILRFDVNVPVEVALKYAGSGKSIEGRYGNRVLYTLVDNRVMYVAPIVASRISELGIQPGECFQICKLEKRQGQTKRIEWQVQRIPSEIEGDLEHQLRESIDFAQAAKLIQPTIAGEEPAKDLSAEPHALSPVQEQCQEPQEQEIQSPIDLAPDVAAMSNGASHGSSPLPVRNGNGLPASTTKLEHALKTAISAAYSAEKYGTELGYTVRFDADAIKSMAITVLINMNEGGRR